MTAIGTRRQMHDTSVPTVRLTYDAEAVLLQTRTAYQDLALFDNERFGRVLMLDSATAVTTADAFIYHEMLAHVPIFSHGSVQDVLIIGGGDGGLAQEVLKHRQIRRVVQAEIDPSVVEVARRHLTQINAGVFEDERFQLKICDGAAFIDGMDERFDVVLVDARGPVGPGSKLFSVEFFRSIRRCLRLRGVLVVRAGVPFVWPDEFSTTMHNLSRVFRFASCYLTAAPTCVGGHLALGWASDSLTPSSVPLEEIRRRHEAAALELRYYTPEVDRAAFALPAYIQKLVAGDAPGRVRTAGRG